MAIRPFIYIDQGSALATIGIGTPSTGVSIITTSSLTFSHTVAAGNSRVLIVATGAVDATVGDTVATGVTYGGIAMTSVDSQTSAAGNQDIGGSLWILPAPAVGTANVVITYTGACDGKVGIACVFTNVDQTTPQDVAATGASGSAATSTSLSRTSATAGALGVDLTCTRLLKTHNEGTSPQTMLTSDQSTGGEDMTLSVSTELNAVAGSFSMSRTWTGSEIYTQSMMVLRPAS